MALYLVFLILYNLGIFSFLTTIMLPLPLIIFSMMSKRTSEVIFLFIGCLVGAYFVASLFGVIATLIYGLSGLVLGLSMVKNRPYWQRLLNAAIVHVIGIPLLTFLISGTNMSDTLLGAINESLAMAENLMPTADFSTVTAAFNRVVREMMPTVLLLAGLISAFFTDKLAIFILKRLNLEVPATHNWQNYQLGIFLGLIYMLAQLIYGWFDLALLNIILLNVVLLLNVLFAIQGFIVLIMFFQSRLKHRVGVVLGILILLLGLSTLLSLIGIMDALFNYRKRFFLKSGL